MMQEKVKKKVGWKALEYIKKNTIIGVGTGSTISYFIEAIASIKNKIIGVVSSSNASTEQLKKLGIYVFDSNEVDVLEMNVDGADEINKNMQMIKGGGAALTREKVIAGCSKQFLCIIDDSKNVEVLGKYPLPIEVITMARSYVARALVKIGGVPILRKKLITDNGNVILDVHHLIIKDAIFLENIINSIEGVVTVGLFAKRRADLLLVGTREEVKLFYKREKISFIS